ncbi:MAG: hypothetical protein EHM20_00320 [Alphaproteobacteria bacterium]|nr:MAG: hypothetical protein EHM20_00320 [Alphaproteobacteria bacterium]
MVTKQQAQQDLFKKLTPKEEQERTQKVEDLLNVSKDKRLTPPSYTFTTGGGGSSSGGGTSTPAISNEALTQIATIQDTKASTYSDAVRRNAQIATILRNEAKKNGVDISTPAKERGYISRITSQIKTEQSKPQEVQQGQSEQAYYEERVVDTFQVNGKTIPETAVFKVDPITGESRRLTPSEMKEVKTERVLQASEGKRSKSAFVGEVVGKFQQKERGFAERTTVNLSNIIQKKTGFSISQIAGIAVSESSKRSFSIDKLIIPKISSSSPFVIGAVASAVTKDIIEKPVSNVALYGVGAGVGGAFKVIPSAIKTGIKSLQVIAKREKYLPSIGTGKVISKLIDNKKTFSFTNLKFSTGNLPSKMKGARSVDVYVGVSKTKIKPSFVFKTGFVGLYTAGVVSSVVNAPTIQGKIGTSAVLLKDTLLFGSGTKAGVKAFTPVETRTALRDIKTPTFVEFKQNAIIGGRETKLIEYKIFGETRPPIRIETTTPFKQQFFQYNERILPARPFVVKTLEPSLAGRDFLVSSKVGKYSKQMKIINIAGNSKKLNLATEYKTLPKLDKFVLQRLEGGVITLKTNQKIIQSTLEAKDVANVQKINSKSLNIILPKEGRTINRQLIMTKSTKIGETDLYKLSTQKMKYKDITYPFARSSGKTPSMRGITIEYKKPLIIDLGGKNVEVIKSSGTKTSLSSTFQKQKLSSELPKFAPKISATKNSFKTTTSKNILKNAVSYPVAPFLKEESVSIQKTQGRVLSSQSSAIKTTIGVKSLNQLKLVSMEKSISLERSSSLTKQTPRLTQKIGQKVIQKQQQKQIQKYSIMNYPPNPSPKSPPRRYYSSKKVSPFKFNFGTIKSSSSTKSYGVQVRRRGKFQTIGKGLSLQGAMNLGRLSTSQSLSATYKLFGGDTSRARTPYGYRKKATKTGIEFIELPKFRISTGGEKRQIQFARRKG